MLQTLPCSSCAALCCGPVALSRDRLEKIKAYVQTMPKAARKRLAAQERDIGDCRFLDMSSHRCAIYAVRPWICGAFGRVPGMQCPKVSELVQIIPSFLEENRLVAEYQTEIACVSNFFDWLKLE